MQNTNLPIILVRNKIMELEKSKLNIDISKGWQYPIKAIITKLLNNYLEWWRILACSNNSAFLWYSTCYILITFKNKCIISSMKSIHHHCMALLNSHKKQQKFQSVSIRTAMPCCSLPFRKKTWCILNDLEFLLGYINWYW